jgi:hypothetical protein
MTELIRRLPGALSKRKASPRPPSRPNGPCWRCSTAQLPIGLEHALERSWSNSSDAKGTRSGPSSCTRSTQGVLQVLHRPAAASRHAAELRPLRRPADPPGAEGRSPVRYPTRSGKILLVEAKRAVPDMGGGRAADRHAVLRDGRDRPRPRRHRRAAGCSSAPGRAASPERSRPTPTCGSSSRTCRAACSPGPRPARPQMHTTFRPERRCISAADSSSPASACTGCRDTFASDLFAAGVDIRIIQELLGHDSLTSTQKYTQVRKEQREMAIRTLLPQRPAC